MNFIKKIFSNILSTIISTIILFVILLIFFSTLVNYMNKKDRISVEENTVLKIDLSTPVVERSADNPIQFINSSGDNPIELKDVLLSIEKAKNDDRIKLIYLNFNEVNAGLSCIEEIRAKLVDYKTSGKQIIAYSNYYSQYSYLLCSVADKIYLNPNGFIDLKGISASVVFFKNLLAKIGVETQIIRKGQFKSAVEPFTETKMSSSSRLQTKLLIEDISEFMTNCISEERNIEVSKINNDINELRLNSAAACKKLNYIDDILYEDQLKDSLKLFSSSAKIKTIDLKSYVNVKLNNKQKISRNKIAVIYANGTISNNKGSLNEIGTQTITKSLVQAREDKNVKAIVLRVNSPGGSAMTSDLIWRETIITKKEKPIIVSMGDYAASGGYYIACAADSIFSNKTTVTGSIGVFGIIPNLKKLYNENLSVFFDTVNTHKYSDMGTNRRLTNFEIDRIRENINQIYSDFINKVAAGRNMDTLYVDNIGQGRVWSGAKAKEIGLVDTHGGLFDAIDAAKLIANIDEYRIIELPKKKDPFQNIFSKINSSSKFLNLIDNYNFKNLEESLELERDIIQMHMNNIIFFN
ncbi:signal peptide peptidase SppA [Bacteroidota bacterium]|nr:signal peptide peptidase SppA [Bacteroidota bacterium]MDC3229842.1 signal peptide peptidase SppA [Bacteroidota bacterium]